MNKFQELYNRTALNNLGQILANSGCAPKVVLKEESNAPAWLRDQPAAMANIVVIWDVYMVSLPGSAAPYIGSVRLEMGSHIDVQSTIKALKGVETVLHKLWMESPMAAMPGTAAPLPAWCMAPEQP